VQFELNRQEINQEKQQRMELEFQKIMELEIQESNLRNRMEQQQYHQLNLNQLSHTSHQQQFQKPVQQQGHTQYSIQQQKQQQQHHQQQQQQQQQPQLIRATALLSLLKPKETAPLHISPFGTNPTIYV
jgi:broad specificity polyphosphatase/5'/3'-nucleotidase SurE